MFPLGHLGITAALGEFLSRRGHYFPHVDFRLIALGAFLPDLIDKPLFFFIGLGEGRGVGHSLIFNALLTIVLLLWSRRPVASAPIQSARSVLTLVAIGAWTHLLLDRVWEQPWVFLFPFLGLDPPELVPGEGLMLPLFLHDPYIVAGELVGLMAIAVMTLRHKLYRKTNLRRVATTGRLR